jgi:hypothetical protein
MNDGMTFLGPHSFALAEGKVEVILHKDVGRVGTAMGHFYQRDSACM